MYKQQVKPGMGGHVRPSRLKLLDVELELGIGLARAPSAERRLTAMTLENCIVKM